MRNHVREKQTEKLLDLLTELRYRKNLSQRQVFEKSGVDVSKYESKHCVPRVTSLFSLCEVYEIDVVGFWLVHKALLRQELTLAPE